MKKIISLIAIAILTLLTACSKSTDNNQPIITPTTRSKVWFYGDSMTEGYGASKVSNRWTSQLCGLKNWYETNEGKAYETLIQGPASEDVGHTSFFSKYQTAIIPLPTD